MRAMSAEPTFDRERQAQARAFARQRHRLYFAELGLSAALALAWLGLGWSTALAAWLRGLTGNDWLVVVGFGTVFGATFEIVGRPLAYYAGFHLPHRYGLSTQTLRGWVQDQVVGLTLAAGLGLPLLSGVYWLLRVAGDSWWLWAAGGYIIFAVALSVVAPVIILPLFNRYTPLGDEHAELVRRLTGLAERAGTRVAGVFRFDLSRRTRAANAALTGLGRTRRIILGDTLLNEFSADEVEVVIAHELGHHVHGDIPLLLAANSAATTAGLFLAAQVLNWGGAAFGFAGPADIAALPLLGLGLGAFGLGLQPVQNAFSRWRERLADGYALQATRKPEAFVSAFLRLADQNLTDVDPEPWVVFLFASHPPIRERLAAAREFAIQP